jgi:hypothetical protein
MPVPANSQPSSAAIGLIGPTRVAEQAQSGGLCVQLQFGLPTIPLLDQHRGMALNLFEVEGTLLGGYSQLQIELGFIILAR